MPNTKRGFYHPTAIIILAVITLSFALVFFINTQYFLRKHQSSPTPAPQYQSSPTASPQKSPINETANPDSIGANWKTYTNDKLGFSLDYPQNWFINTDSEIDIYLRNQDFESKTSQSKPRYPNSGYPDDYEYIRVLNNVNEQETPGYTKPIDWYRDLASRNQKANVAGGGYDLTTVKTFLLNGKASIIVKNKSDETTAFVLTPIGENVHRLIVSPYEKINDKEVIQILSTFKFTN